MDPAPFFGDFVSGAWRSECFGPFQARYATLHVNQRTHSRQLLPAFGEMPLDRIGRKDVIDWYDRYSATAPGGANRAIDTLLRILTNVASDSHPT